MKIGFEYIAAFIDCDGTVGITKAKPKKGTAPQYYARVAFYSQNLAVLQDIQETVGGQICSPKSHGTYNLQLAPKDSLACLEATGPYLRIKSKQAELALRLHERIAATSVRGKRTASGARVYTPAEVLAEREAMYLEMKRLNKLDSKTFKENRMNSAKALKRVTPSQAAKGEGFAEGVTTRRVSPNNNPAHESPTGNDDAGRHSLDSAHNLVVN